MAIVGVIVLFVAGSFMITLTSIDLLNRADWDQFHFLEDGLIHKVALSGGDFNLTIGGDFLELLDFLLQGEVGALQVLDELVLSLHDEDLFVKPLLQLKVD